MDHWISTFLLAAEEVPAAPGQPAAQPGAAPSSPFGGLTMILLPVMAIILFMQMGNNPRKQQERQLEALKNLKKNDPVVTIGGMRGQFVSLSEDGSEVTVQLADNIRIRFDASAIRIPQTPPAKA
ncbi:MAG: preprotein translocase subunit YajC [Planctomycetota bacterium]|nr:MAG: preprotein translocase subunit YajC [Planctomycetota bacterium]